MLDPVLHDRAALAQLQLTRLRETLAHAYAHNAHYKRSFDAAGVTPDDLRGLADLARFPFTTKDDLRANYPYGFFCVPMAQVTRLHASSGTTGKPTVVGYTKRDIENWAALVARSIRVAGGEAGMKVHVAYGYGLFTGGLGAHYGAELAACTVIPMSGGQSAKQVQLICDLAPDIIMVTPSYALTLLDEFHRQGVDPRGTSLKLGIFGAEPWSDSLRREIEQSFAIDAVDIYGLSEVMGPGVASEFVATKDGPVVWEDHFLPEIIDPDTGEALPDGEEGELVFTSLTKEAMPIVRYRTRDRTRLLPGTNCAARRIARISGRTDDMLILRGVNVFPSQIEELLVTCDGLSPHYQLELTRPERMDELTVLVEADPAQGDAPAAQLRTRIKDMIGVTVAVRLVGPGTLERSAGKAQRLKDLR
ncbi:AMP-binding protein [Roseiterribacter gracilis]|uniref:Phenylacetate-coenzyme A ligase n=1 Tax=Roseiterribacter gracilis TaxID=2812848 RepID=A0A8S8X8P3_9PROT|nr:phenylacetate-coenzyme A ligase [Rhodospirillales bacterium TMPK1]